MRWGILASVLALAANSGWAHGQAVPFGTPGTGPVPVVVPNGQPAGVEMDDGPSAFDPLPHDGAGPDAGYYKPGPSHHCWWVSADYLLWTNKDASLPAPLVTTGSSGFGVLGAPDTAILFGGADINYKSQSGARVTVGRSGTDQSCGLEITGLYLPERTAEFHVSSSPTGTPLLARPFTDAASGLATSSIIAAPATAGGSVDITSATQVWGTEINVVRHMFSNNFVHNAEPVGRLEMDAVMGVRYLDLTEDLAIAQDSNLLPGSLAAFNGAIIVGPGTLAIRDRWDVRNQFYGGQLGTQTELQIGSFFVNVLAKVAIGMTHETITVNGNTTLTQAGAAVQALPGGLLALASNSTKISSDRFTWMPEGAVNVGWECWKNFRLFVGYTFLYWSEVVRPGEQVNPLVNLGQVPTSLAFGSVTGPPAPPPTSHHTNYWMQGFNGGFAFRF